MVILKICRLFRGSGKKNAKIEAIRRLQVVPKLHIMSCKEFASYMIEGKGLKNNSRILKCSKLSAFFAFNF